MARPDPKKKVLDFLGNDASSWELTGQGKEHLKQLTFEDYKNLYSALRESQEDDLDAYKNGACGACVPSCTK